MGLLTRQSKIFKSSSPSVTLSLTGYWSRLQLSVFNFSFLSLPSLTLSVFLAGRIVFFVWLWSTLPYQIFFVVFDFVLAVLPACCQHFAHLRCYSNGVFLFGCVFLGCFHRGLLCFRCCCCSHHCVQVFSIPVPVALLRIVVSLSNYPFLSQIC